MNTDDVANRITDRITIDTAMYIPPVVYVVDT